MVNKLPVARGLAPSYVTNIPEQWSAAWFRYFITNFLANADVRNSNTYAGAQLDGSIDTPASLSTISGMPPVILDDGGGDWGDDLIVPGPPGVPASNISAWRSGNLDLTTSSLTSDSELVLSFPGGGVYALELFLVCSGVQGKAGIQFDFGQGTAGLDTVVYAAVGTDKSYTSNTAIPIPQIAASQTTPTWIWVKGFFDLTSGGTLGIRLAQNTFLPSDPTTVQAGSFISAYKIG